MRLFTVSRVLGAPIGEVWALTSAFGAIGLWASGISRVSVTGAGIGAVRRVTTEFGTVAEQLTLIDADNHRIRYTVDAGDIFPAKGLAGGIDLTAVSSDKTKLEWVVEADSVEGDIAPLEPAVVPFITEAIAKIASVIGASVE